jgi:hypothetical protein|tara:strand:+ start:61 stop:507 length:447 start_codon:yes stop_codon:yes gene_type:complete
MSYPNPWYYNGQIFESTDIGDYYGFVYILENKDTERFYVGKKFFLSAKTLPVTKTRKRKKKIKVESTWKDYYGSNKQLQEEIQEKGVDNVSRNILWLCNTKTQCAYYEVVEQVDRRVLLSDKYYNEFMGGKISGRFLTEIKRYDKDIL